MHSKAIAVALWALLLVNNATGALVPGDQSQNQTESDGGNDNGESSVAHIRPRRFDENVLNEMQLLSDYVPELGRVMVLNTFVTPSKTKLGTRFSLYRANSLHTATIYYSYGTYCKLGADEEYAHYGPYEFDLDQIVDNKLAVAGQQIIVLVPGYMSHDETPWPREARKNWLELKDDDSSLAIEVYWNDLTYATYGQAVANTVVVARQITILLHYLAELGGTHLMDPDFLSRVHLVGHSLGAHISGFVGQDLGGKLGRITGLDPAGPSFEESPRHERLDRSDARLVEVMHTNIGHMKYMNFVFSSLLAGLSVIPGRNLISRPMSSQYTGEGDTAWFGIDDQLGHIEFYANNGRVQPGCEGVLHICDHRRSNEIYVDMLKYRCSLKRSSSTASLLHLLESQDQVDRGQLAQVNRLLAFRSPDFESFASGSNFVHYCPELMDVQTHLSDSAVLKTFNRCSVPIFDLSKPVDEVIDELKTKYGISFDDDDGDSDSDVVRLDNEDDEGASYARFFNGEGSSGDSASQDANSELGAAQRKRPSFYFKTSPDNQHLVGDHFLLKIHLAGRQPTWDETKCTLMAQIIMADGEKINLELRRVVEPEANQRVLAMPFVYHKSSQAKDRFNAMVHLVRMFERSAENVAAANGSAPAYVPSSEFAQVFENMFPSRIVFKIAKPKSQTLFSAVKTVAMAIIKSDDPITPYCQLTTNMIEVHPLVYGLKRNFGALYGRDLFLSGSTLKAISTSDQLKQLEDPNRPVTTMSSDSIRSYAVGLESAIIG